MYKVYKHVFPNNKIYIGITKQDVKKRWKNGYGYEKGLPIRNAIDKFGWLNIEHIVLFDNLSKQEAEQKEIELIKKYKSTNRKYCYNITNGGNCVGTVAEETKEKIKRKNKEYVKNNPQSICNIGYWKNKKLSEEHRRKLSESHKGKKQPISKETKEKISLTLMGHEVTLETKIKLAKPVKCIETGKQYYSAREAEKDTGISYKMISACCNKKRKTTHNTHWIFA